MTTWVIGDVQGCFDALRRLLDRIRFDIARDQLWFVGDLVNRGPNSAGVLRLVRGLRDRAVAVLGNHDLHLLAVARGVRPARPDDTLHDVLAADDRDALLEWLSQLPLVYCDSTHLLVHAGLLPQWSAVQARALSAEVEAALQGKQSDALLAAMYGGKPAAWNDTLEGWDRLRVIINATTRMRFCTREGVMEFHHKDGPASAPKGYLPWFEAQGRWRETHRVLFGHWSTLGLHQSAHATGLDTGCVWGGSLSAFSLDDRRLVQVSAQDR